MNRKIVAANWKMNLDFQQVINLLNALSSSFRQENVLSENVQTVICPSFIWLALAKQMLQNISHVSIGAQNVSAHDHGAYTGEISAHMLASFEVSYVIVGHSERRMLFNETNEGVMLKAKATAQNQMIPIICVGESEQERKNSTFLQAIEQQLEPLIQEPHLLKNAIIAYEPIWAIGTGLVPTVEEIDETHCFIQAFIFEKTGYNIAVLYGGSVKGSNAKALAQINSVGGFLVGGASLNASDFFSITQCFN